MQIVVPDVTGRPVIKKSLNRFANIWSAHHINHIISEGFLGFVVILHSSEKAFPRPRQAMILALIFNPGQQLAPIFIL